MTESSQATIRPSLTSVRPSALRTGRFPAWTASALSCAAALVLSCAGNDNNGLVIGGAGSSSHAGNAGAGGSSNNDNVGLGGSPGSSGTGGAGGGSTRSGGSGTAGSGGAVPAPLTGTITQLSADSALRGPTTAALRGTTLWVVDGQLATLGTGNPVLPFEVVSLPLAGGAIGDSITLPGNAFFPEGIAAAADGTLFIGSVNQGTIIRVPPASTTPDSTPFVPGGVAQRGVLGLAVDETAGHNLLWFCDSNPTRSGAALVGVSLANGTESVRHTLPNPGSTLLPDAGVDAGGVADAGSDAGLADGGAGDAGADAGATVPSAFCNDVIVDPTGNVLFTDSSGRIFRIAAANVLTPNSAEVLIDSPALGPIPPSGIGANGLELVGGQLIVAGTEQLFALNPNSPDPTATLRPIALTENGSAKTLCGPDGLQAIPNSNTDLVVVENGSCTTTADRDRVIRVSLNLTP